MKCGAKHVCSCAGRSAQARESMLCMSMCYSRCLARFARFYFGNLQRCDGRSGRMLGNLYQFMGNHGQRVTWSWKWTLMVIFRYVCLALVAALIFSSCEGLPVCCRTPLRRQQLLFEGSAEDLTCLYRMHRTHVQSFSLLCLEGSRISATNWIRLRSWRVLKVLPVAQRPGRRDTRYGYVAHVTYPDYPGVFQKFEMRWWRVTWVNLDEIWWMIVWL